MRYRWVALLLFFATSVSAAPGANLDAALPQIEAAFAAHMEKQHLPGAAVGIIVDGELVWLKAAGLRDVAGEAPVTDDSVFRIASMTKSFTAMAILKLRDEGKLSLDDPASRYVPELAKLRYPTTDSAPITIRQLLTHSEGFPEDNPWGDRQLARSDATMSAWMRQGIPFSTSPGTAYEYSNYGFAILGRIIQRVSKQPYAQYVREKILLPLGMTSSTFEVSEIPANKLVKGYRWDATAKQWVEEPALPHGSYGAMGGLWTTPHDLAKYVSFLLSAFPSRDEPERGPVRRSSAREMQQAWRSGGPAYAMREAITAPLQLTVTSYGYGLLVAQDCRSAHIVQHGGGLPGYGSLMRWLPDYGVGIIALGNVTYAGWRPLFDELLGTMLSTGALQKRSAVPSPALLQAQKDVTSLMMKWDETLAVKIAADNLFLDEPQSLRREKLAKLAETHGTCRSAATIDAENALRGEWELPCERGSLRVRITLAPTTPPKVQYLNVRSILPPSATAREAIEKELASVPAQWGRCSIGEAAGEEAVRLECERGVLVARYAEGKVTVAPLRDADHRCVP